MNIFRYITSSIKLDYAIAKAENAHIKDGHRYYVLPYYNGKLIIVNRLTFKNFKKRGMIDRRASVSDLEKECFYCTKYSDGNGCLPPEGKKLKKRMYMSYIEDFLKSKKGIKHNIR